MKILQIVTLFDPENSYGGPTRVALNQVRELSERGNEVLLIAGARGFPHDQPLPSVIDGVKVRLFPATRVLPVEGFAGYFSRQMVLWLRRNVQYFDVVHLHLARDLITLPAAEIVSRQKSAWIAQTHGSIDRPRHPLAAPLDALSTRRILRSASKLAYLTELERKDLVEVAGPEIALQYVPNGVPLLERRRPYKTADESPKIIFLGRIHPQKRAAKLVSAAAILRSRGVQADFDIVGPDGGAMEDLRLQLNRLRLGDTVTISGPLAPEKTSQYLSECDVYVLPSISDTFPMSCLEAMSVGLPVILTRSCGLAESVASAGAGIVVEDGDELALANALETLIRDKGLREAMGERGRNLVVSDYGSPAIASLLESIYAGAIGKAERE